MTASVVPGGRRTGPGWIAPCVALAGTLALVQWIEPTTAAAAVLLATSTRSLEGVTGLAGSLVAGAVIGGGLGLALAEFAAVGSAVAAGLGVALGGGVGAVSQYALAGTDEASDEHVTVDMEETERSPQPADLFDGHPDPILYVVDEGHGPVVRAANAAYADAFGVGSEGVTGAPLDEALFASDADDLVAEIADGAAIDRRVACETPDGDREFRLRWSGAGDDGYLLFTPV
ncbi:hypothetical protein [Halomicrobium salinisoli]|uniref:hypothetical protein n=1 Tax=Halomicrobium salinisoli TaxID=2878391 RepID=UPI001CF022D0|nr:hypothetical protein [Halomicrobium salinisoli]